MDAKPLEPILSPTNFTSTSRLVSQQTFYIKIMKIKLLALTLTLLLIGCADRKAFSSVEVNFKPSGQMVDLVGISGLDMGPMYTPASYTPRNVGDKGYISYDDVILDDELVFRWRLSKGDHEKVFTQVVKRPHNIPKIIPRNSIVRFRHSGGHWTILLDRS